MITSKLSITAKLQNTSTDRSQQPARKDDEEQREPVGEQAYNVLCLLLRKKKVHTP